MLHDKVHALRGESASVSTKGKRPVETAGLLNQIVRLEVDGAAHRDVAAKPGGVESRYQAPSPVALPNKIALAIESFSLSPALGHPLQADVAAGL